MIILYPSRRSKGFILSGEASENSEFAKIKYNAKLLLVSRGELETANYLEKIPFRISTGLTNGFYGDVHVLNADVSLELYEELRVRADRDHFEKIANVISEIGPYISYVGVDLDLKDRPVKEEKKNDVLGLKEKQINKLVYGYIGVTGGYLGDFSYKSHHDFYRTLELDINPYKLEGTTRERFIQIISISPPPIQAKILEGILERYSVGSAEIRTQDKYDDIRCWIDDLLLRGVITAPTPQSTSDIVLRALADAAQLISSRGTVSGVDRMHTALHGYFRAVCVQVGIEVSRDASVTELFKVLRENHPTFQNLGARTDEITKILRAFAAVIDALNPIRNRASVAHPNEELLDEPEAVLVINAIRSLLQYIDSKISNDSK